MRNAHTHIHPQSSHYITSACTHIISHTYKPTLSLSFSLTHTHTHAQIYTLTQHHTDAYVTLYLTLSHSLARYFHPFLPVLHTHPYVQNRTYARTHTKLSITRFRTDGSRKSGRGPHCGRSAGTSAIFASDGVTLQRHQPAESIHLGADTVRETEAIKAREKKREKKHKRERERERKGYIFERSIFVSHYPV